MIADIHSHVLFGIDDGAESIEMSLEMLKMAEGQGVKHLFCTSHHWSGGISDYNDNFALLKKRAEEENISVKLYTGMEVLCSKRHLSEVVGDIAGGEAKALNNTDFILLEMFPDMSGEEIFECVNLFITKTSKRVILAHPERYEGLYSDRFPLECLRELGCLFQINAYSLEEERKQDIKAFARKILSEGLVDFIGSDAHRTNHRAPRYTKGIDYIYSNCDKAYADRICFENAERLLINI